MQKRAIRPEDGIIVYLIALGLYEIMGLILRSALKTQGDAFLFVMYALPQLFYVGTAVVYFIVRKVAFFPFPNKEDFRISHYFFAAIVGLGLFFFALFPNYGIIELIKLMGKSWAVQVPAMNTAGNIVLGVLIICLLPAIGEELMFRKIFCDAFSAYGKIPAILISGVLFGLGHFNPAQTVHQIVLGIVLSYIYVKTKNITLTSIIHFGNNFLALFMTKFTGEEPWTNLVVLGVCFAVGAVLLVGGLLFFFFKTPRLPRKGKWVSAGEASETEETEIVAIYTDGKKFVPETTEVREKPSVFVYVFFGVITLFWLLSAFVG